MHPASPQLLASLATIRLLTGALKLQAAKGSNTTIINKSESS